MIAAGPRGQVGHGLEPGVTCGPLITAAFTVVQEAITAEMGALTNQEQETLGSLCKKLGLHETGS